MESPQTEQIAAPQEVRSNESVLPVETEYAQTASAREKLTLLRDKPRLEALKKVGTLLKTGGEKTLHTLDEWKVPLIIGGAGALANLSPDLVSSGAADVIQKTAAVASGVVGATVTDLVGQVTGRPLSEIQNEQSKMAVVRRHLANASAGGIIALGATAGAAAGLEKVTEHGSMVGNTVGTGADDAAGMAAQRLASPFVEGLKTIGNKLKLPLSPQKPPPPPASPVK